MDKFYHQAPQSSTCSLLNALPAILNAVSPFPDRYKTMCTARLTRRVGPGRFPPAVAWVFSSGEILV